MYGNNVCHTRCRTCRRRLTPTPDHGPPATRGKDVFVRRESSACCRFARVTSVDAFAVGQFTRRALNTPTPTAAPALTILAVMVITLQCGTSDITPMAQTICPSPWPFRPCPVIRRHLRQRFSTGGLWPTKGAAKHSPEDQEQGLSWIPQASFSTLTFFAFTPLPV